MNSEIEWAVRDQVATFPVGIGPDAEEAARSLAMKAKAELLSREINPWTVVDSWVMS